MVLSAPGADAQSDPDAEAGDRFGAAVARGDFNGDGRDDLAVGAPSEGITNGPFVIAGAGSVDVVYGTSSGLASANRQFWRQGSAGVNDGAESGDGFGSSLAVGDFNGDGYDDLAVGAPFEDVGTVYNAGAVSVIYGSATGLSASAIADQFWHQNVASVQDVAEADDGFGLSLATGDFNGDGYDDLAVGVPGEDVGAIYNAGAVNVIYGTPTGLSAVGVPNQFWDQDVANVEGVAGLNDHFGQSIAAGDFNGDGYHDLAVGVPHEDVGDPDYMIFLDAGAVNVIYGTATGLNATVVPDQFWHQDVTNVEGVPHDGDKFGWSLAAGDFTADARDDLAIGVPHDSPDGVYLAGAVNVIYGSAVGLSATAVRDQYWHQNVYNVEGWAGNGDFFGASLAVGNFNGDGFDDLAIGAPSDYPYPVYYSGVVNVIYGWATGLSATKVADQLWRQDAANVEDVAESWDHFGSSLATGDFNGDGREDLAIGVRDEDLGTLNGTLIDAGAVNVLYGATFGLDATTIPDQFWTQNVILPPRP